MNLPKKSLLLAASLAALSLMQNASAVVIFQDTFTGISNPNSAGWYSFNSNSGGGAWTIATDNTAPLSGNVLSNPAGAVSNTSVYKQFSTTTLTNVGDSISISLDLHSVTGVGSIGISLLGTNQTITANQFGGTVLTNAAGYGFGLQSTQERTFLTAGTGNLWEVSNNDPIPYTTYLGNVSASTPITTNAVTFSLTLTKTATGVQIDSSYGGTVFSSYTDTTGSIYTSFNTVRIFGNPASGNKIDIDNVTVTTVPEPSAVALLAVGLTAVVVLRRAPKARGLK